METPKLSRQFNPEDYQFIRVYKCINDVGLNVMQMVFGWGLRLSDNETLKDCIQKKEKYQTNKAYKSRYDIDQRKKIEAYDVAKDQNFDVSIYYKLIQDTSYNIAPMESPLWITKSSSQLENLLHSTKNARNKLSHNQLSLDKAGAHHVINEYRTIFLNLIESAGARYGRDITSEIAKLNNDIDEIINYPLMENEIQQLFREQIHERSKNKMVDEGAKEIKELYKKKSDLNPLTLIDGSNFRLPVAKVYKKLEIRDCGRYSKNIVIDSDDILRLNGKYETVNELNESVDLVLLEGPTGSGKTTITKLLLAEWSTNPNSLIKGLLDYDLLIYMECRNPNTEQTLDKLLHCLMPSTCNNLEEEAAKTLSACSVLVIIDSLEEMNEKSEVLVKELLELIKRKNVTGICTMRPTKTQEVFSLVPLELKKLHLKTRGIPDDQRGSFVEMYHEELRSQGKSEQSTQELIEHLNKSSSRLQEHLRYPINLVHLVYLWAIAPQKVRFVTTATELYSSIHEIVLVKLSSERLNNNPLTMNLSDEERKKKTKKFLRALCIEALFNLSRQNFCILPKDSEEKLKQVCEENRLPLCEMLSAFLVTKNLWTSLTAQTEFSISHRDMQEYLAACCIFDAISDYKCQHKLEKRIRGPQGKNLLSTLDGMNISTLKKSPVTDILKIFSPSLEIPLKDYQNVLKHLSGLFVKRNNESTLSKVVMPSNVAKDLINLFKKSGMQQPEDWLDIYAETKSDKNMEKYIRKLCDDMLCGDIIVRDTHLAAYVTLLTPEPSQSCKGDVVDSASIVRAKSLVLYLKNPPSELPDLKVLMFHVGKLECNIELHLYYHWRNPQPGIRGIILNETQRRCNLKVLRGSPCSDELRATCSSLEKLYVSIYDESHAKDILPMLNYDHLPKLKAIYIHLKCGNDFSEVLSPLYFQNAVISLFLSNVDDANVTWAVKVAHSLQSTNSEYRCLYLPNNQLSSLGFLHLVESLHNDNVKIMGYIGVTCNIDKEDLDETLDAAAVAAKTLGAAKAAAKSQLHRNLVWYFSAERMEGW